MGKFAFYPGDGEHGEVCADYDIMQVPPPSTDCV